uniref:PLAT domain-containing protein n=1 Tax=Macrostomum lignano TaxID=282301 RepID=A0A1I8F9Y1_9PLAT
TGAKLTSSRSTRGTDQSNWKNQAPESTKSTDENYGRRRYYRTEFSPESRTILCDLHDHAYGPFSNHFWTCRLHLQTPHLNVEPFAADAVRARSGRNSQRWCPSLTLRGPTSTCGHQRATKFYFQVFTILASGVLPTLLRISPVQFPDRGGSGIRVNLPLRRPTGQLAGNDLFKSDSALSFFTCVD